MATVKGALTKFDGVVLGALQDIESSLNVCNHGLQRETSAQASRDDAAQAEQKTERLFAGARATSLELVEVQRTLARPSLPWHKSRWRSRMIRPMCFSHQAAVRRTSSGLSTATTTQHVQQSSSNPYIRRKHHFMTPVGSSTQLVEQPTPVTQAAMLGATRVVGVFTSLDPLPKLIGRRPYIDHGLPRSYGTAVPSAQQRAAFLHLLLVTPVAQCPRFRHRWR